jgi:drug/metabolite transporter (DMT)-like permease
VEVLGAICALAAATLFGWGIVLQAGEARRVPRAHAMRLALLVRLARSPRWLVGTALTVVGWGLHASAFRLAPVTIVQPALAFTLVVVLLGSRRVLGEPVGAREVAAVAGLVVGLVLLIAAAPPRSAHHTHGARLLIPLVALAVLAVAPLWLSTAKGSRPLLAAGTAGVAFALSGIATKLLTDALSVSGGTLAIAWIGLVVAAALLGGIAEMSSLQVGRASRVIPITFAFEITLPVALAPLLFGEQWRTLETVRIVTLVVALTAVLASALTLAASPGVTHVVATETPPL